MEFLGFRSPSNRPYEELPDEEIVERYVRARIKLEDGSPMETKRELITRCNHLMEEWEWRHGGLTEFDRRANEVEERLRADERS